MIHAVDNLASELASALREEAEYYARAVELSESLTSTLQAAQAPQAIDPALQQILELLQSVGRIESRVGALKQEWVESKSSPSHDLGEAVARVKELIVRLSERLRETEEAATALKRNLLPELDAMIRSRQMLQAYAGT